MFEKNVYLEPPNNAINARNEVTHKLILPGIRWDGIRTEQAEAMHNKELGRNICQMYKVVDRINLKLYSITEPGKR